MCGLVGFSEPWHDPAEARRTVQAMADQIRHRGPDGEGTYADARTALGHRRLSIIDREGGGQPMFNEDGELVAVFNGEIYNYRELAMELEQAGHVFATRSDTEVLLHGWEQWGDALPERLRGMFAFVLWDRRTSTLFAARDLFGIKPLYYYQRGGLLLFASEIKAFLAHPAFEKRLNEERLGDWLSIEYLPGDETMFTGVRELLPGHCFRWQDGRLELRRWGVPQFAVQTGRRLGDWAEAIDAAFTGSVQAHRLADVEVGCFLSGGVDSALTACKAAAQQEKLRCFSVGYGEADCSELPAARTAAGLLGVPCEETTLNAGDFFAAARAVQWALDEPMANPAEVPLYFLCRSARRQVKVVLSGEGADELFGGYPLYCQGVHAAAWQRLPGGARRLAARALPGCGFFQRGALERWQRSARANYVFSGPAERDRYLKHPPDHTPADCFRPYFDAVRELDEPTALQWVDLQTWLPRDILRKADRMSMAHGLELRVPFLDREVLAAAMALPRPLRCTRRKNKVALRVAAARSLPAGLARRPKRGFPVPLAAWLRQEPWYTQVRAALTGPVAEQFFHTRALAELLDAHRDGRVNAMTKIWSFYCFVVWYELYFLGSWPPRLQKI